MTHRTFVPTTPMRVHLHEMHSCPQDLIDKCDGDTGIAAVHATMWPDCDGPGAYEDEVARLRPAFDLVKDPEAWKNPINATVLIDACDDELIISAVVYYTGSVPEIVYNGDGTKTVTAAGYYMTIGS